MPENRKFDRERNTLKRTVKDYAPDRIELEIGDAKQDDFFPQAKIKRWDNETNFSIRRDNGARSFTERDEKIVAESPREDVVFYELDGFEDGGLEVELHLKEKPNTNVFDFTLQTKGLDFFYQPELTGKEKEEGAHRPENVVGSYAAYHKTKAHNRVGGKEYKTGKAFHIYRPKAHDAEGKETWCELSIGKDVLTVTVPQEFLDTAVYPVVIDPTFGYESVGGSSDTSSQRILGFLATLNEEGDVSSISFYYRNTSGGDVRADAAFYNASRTLLSPQSTEETLDLLDEEWVEFSITGGIELASGDYYVVAKTENPFGASALSRYDSAPGDGVEYITGTGWPEAWPSSLSESNVDEPRQWSIYATYTASSGDATPTPDAHSLSATLHQPTVVTTKNVTKAVSALALTASLLSPNVADAAPTPVNHNAAYGAGAYAAFAYAGGTFTPPRIDATVQPDALTLGAALHAPTVDAEVNATATPAALALQANLLAPTVDATKNVTATPAAQALSATLHSPTIDATKNPTVQPSALVLELSEQTPTVLSPENETATPSALAGELSVLAPTIVAEVNRTATPDALSAEASVNAPTVVAEKSPTATPAALSASLSLHAPTVLSPENITVQPDALALETAVAAPTVLSPENATATPAALAGELMLHQPTVVATKNPTVAPQALSGALTVHDPTIVATISRTATPEALSAAVSLENPTIEATLSPTATPAAQALSATLRAPTISTDESETVAVDPLALAATLHAPTVITEQNRTVEPATLALQLSTETPTVLSPENAAVAPAALSAALTVHQPTVVAEKNATASPAALALQLSTHAPTVLSPENATITPAAMALSASLHALTITAVQTITVVPPALALTASIQDPTIDVPLVDPYCPMDSPYSRMSSPYSKMDSPYSRPPSTC